MEMANVLHQQALDLTNPSLSIEELMGKLRPLVPVFADTASRSNLL